MGIEIERKFLLKNDSWREEVIGTKTICQGYIYSEQGITRIRTSNNQAYLTIKSRLEGISRDEFEYPIPFDDAVEMLEGVCAGKTVKKVRNIVEFYNNTWEIDEFLDENSGLVLAEIELKYEDEKFMLPPWVGKEVTSDMKYYNSNLISLPFSQWNSIDRLWQHRPDNYTPHD